MLTASNIGALALGRFPSPEPGARRGWRFSIIVTAWWVGCALRCPQARLPPHPARAQTGVGGGGGGFQPGLAVRAQNIGFLAQVLAGALCARPPPALPRPGILPLRVLGLELEPNRACCSIIAASYQPPTTSITSWWPPYGTRSSTCIRQYKNYCMP